MKPHPTDALTRRLARVHDESLSGFARRPAARDLLDDITTTSRSPGRRSRTGMRFGLVTAGGLAAVAAVAVTVVQTTGGNSADPRPRPALPGAHTAAAVNVAYVLDQASAAAKARPFTLPRSDQWIYIENKAVGHSSGPGGFPTGGPLRTSVDRAWLRADGTQMGGIDKDGKIEIATRPRTRPLDDPMLVDVPTRPQDLLRWAYEQASTVGMAFSMEDPGHSPSPSPSHTGSPSASPSYTTHSLPAPRSGVPARDQEFAVLKSMLRDHLLPPKVEAAVYQAIKSIPGVTLDKNAKDVDGRPVVAVSHVEGGWLQNDVLFDPKTYRYRGERAIAIKDHRSTGLDGTSFVKKGTLAISAIRVASGIVDKPGQRPS